MKWKRISTNVSEENYTKMHTFLGMYNKRNKKEYTMSKLVWKLLAERMNQLLDEWYNKKKT